MRATKLTKGAFCQLDEFNRILIISKYNIELTKRSTGHACKSKFRICKDLIIPGNNSKRLNPPQA
ncbi:MAG: hypothetical protein A3D24_03755 [Candidatus Blackburnbacteria bacterium RIFCSPHIGHO2_02_FULL_39_13]|uniref:Uncharacterized protein n=1 Tax=Candidatus Blackburnbacteria bacterium RIFCSPLOWO2_01_FULL_40_20 TaxID=1797519 RepID=A0A1G1VD15_9BACT|nr:MAG: hypothetical protein A2694_03720 [Candidatus Blackburnbacteria bacterium RIFCSPHIGHO2_01_FULL_40_17]OGY08508.1 MAG: hypothetical protein A3D24_03755 [Candidatus Blackburnbacteria bacterium RIFCSPHIGHO2_02_FULL_39_13]OGY13275.1 MAG: hypothetical protein A3A77_02490 [Candidatus Blackburnbacteria bacterium RIFCSPLOWO2_01_FULL_40_20]OGY15598.1 MAG: hypothetical protein A3I52_00805 [Candidatus Blackburnbacteria bacterium RIFCSPLOWO2_02_FULL_40_10]HBL51837.1 hypothetical protein [Candidatus B